MGVGILTDSKVLSPKQRRQRNRDEMIAGIVQAARQIMREQGVAALNLNEIARALGVQTPSLYEYFPNKMALYDHLFQFGTRLFRAHIDAMDAANAHIPPSWAQAEQYLIGMVTWALDNPDLFKLLFERHVPGFVPSDVSMAAVYESLESGRRHFESVVRAADLDPGVPIEQAFDLFITVQHGIIALHLANSPELPIGQGRFTPLIPMVIQMMKTAWSKPNRRDS